MATFVLLTKVSRRGITQMRHLAEMDREFEQKLRTACPEVRRIASYALLGPYDFLHIFEAPDEKTAAKVALLANCFGVESTQTLTAIPFDEFTALMQE
ncbi:MAG: GYD domain-containing protein [Anaerolineae bacterium]